jgi:hypothetical protein
MALLALPDFESVGRLLRRLDQALDGTLTAFEVMWQDFYRMVTTPPRGRSSALAASACLLRAG